MRSIFILIGICLQLQLQAEKVKKHSYDTIFVTTSQATYLYFEEPIKRIDCPLSIPTPVYDPLTEEYINLQAVSLLKEDNLISIMANQKQFASSNLFVETNTHIFLFILAYHPSPEKLLYNITSSASEITKTRNSPEDKHSLTANSIVKKDRVKEIPDRNARLEKEALPLQKNKLPAKSFPQNSRLEATCMSLLKEKDNYISGINSQKMLLLIRSIHIIDQKMFFRIYLENKANIAFNVQAVDFFIAAKSPLKKATTQEHILQPEYVYQYPESVTSSVAKEAIFVFDKFTLADREVLFIKVVEENGERDLKAWISAKDLLKAKGK